MKRFIKKLIFNITITYLLLAFIIGIFSTIGIIGTILGIY